MTRFAGIEDKFSEAKLRSVFKEEDPDGAIVEEVALTLTGILTGACVARPC